MNKILIIVLLFNLVLISTETSAEQKLGERVVGQVERMVAALPSGYYYDDELITKLNIYRESNANMYRDIDIDL